MARVHNWPRILNEIIERHREVPFEWGKSDCLQFAREVADALTGRHFPIPKYSTKEGALKQLAKKGYASVEEALADHFSEVPVAMAQRGDLGVIDGGTGALACVVCIGSEWAGKPEDQNLLFMPMASVRRAFRVE